MEIGYPDDFRCPISLEVMTDPVILSSGHTFDRSSIQRWLDSGNRTCPVTNLPLPPSPSLIPNHALRSLISAFSSTPSNSPVSSQLYNDSSSTSGSSLNELITQLSYPVSEEFLLSAYNLAKSGGAGARRRLLDSGVSSILLRHVADGGSCRELALRLLLKLSLDGDDARVGLVAEGAVEPLVAALSDRGPAAALAATLITSLAVVEVNKATIGAHPRAINVLVRLTDHGKERERKEAATALYALAAFPENRKRTVRAGAVPILTQFASEGSERAVEVLGLLAKCDEGRRAMDKVVEFVGTLADVIRKGSSRSTEQALFVLKMICGNNSKMCLIAKEEGLLEICYQLIEEEEGSKIGKYAFELVKILEELE